MSLINRFGVAVFSALFAVSGFATTSTDLSNSTTGIASDGVGSIPYRLFTPQGTQADQKVPLILFLHGAGDRGADNVGQTYWMKDLAAQTKSGQYSAYVLAPQIGTNDWFASNGAPTESMSLTIQALQTAMKNPNVDTSRVYVTGISMGSYGTWDILTRLKNTFAAAVPMSGGGNPATAAQVGKTPIWAFHGSADNIVPVQTTRDMVAAVQAAGGNVKYTEVAGGDHFIWPAAYQDSSLYQWLFSQKLGSVSTDPAFAGSSPESSSSTGGTLFGNSGEAGSTLGSGLTVDTAAAIGVPEPTTLSLLAIGGAALLARRRRRIA